MMTLVTFYDEESLPVQCEQLHTVCKTTAALKKKISWMTHIAITTPINQAFLHNRDTYHIVWKGPTSASGELGGIEPPPPASYAIALKG